MSVRWIVVFIALVASVAPWQAHAAISCTTPVSSGFSTAYNGPGGAVLNATLGTATFTCTSTSAADATTILLRGNNGTNVTGTQNRVRLGATTSYLNYEAYKDSACTSLWTNNAVTANMIVVPILANVANQALSATFYGCVPLGQTPPASGTYTDSWTMRLRNNTNTANIAGAGNGTLTASVVVPASCASLTTPADMLFTYTAFGSAATATTTFNVTCTTNLPYEISLDAYTGVVGGLLYTLNINAVPPNTVTPVKAKGTGAAQTHTIFGNMASGQPGSCPSSTAAACASAQSDARSVTITY